MRVMENPWKKKQHFNNENPMLITYKSCRNQQLPIPWPPSIEYQTKNIEYMRDSARRKLIKYTQTPNKCKLKWAVKMVPPKSNHPHIAVTQLIIFEMQYSISAKEAKNSYTLTLFQSNNSISTIHREVKSENIHPQQQLQVWILV